MTDFDGVVIGAGHNGLALAAYLSRAGMRVAVLERNSRIGGGSSTEERILPGYRLNLHANFYMGIGFCPLLRDLELHRYGFSYIEPPVQQAAVFRDGTAIVVYKDLDELRVARPLFASGCRDIPDALAHLLRGNAAAAGVAALQRADAARAARRPAERTKGKRAALARPTRSLQRRT